MVKQQTFNLSNTDHYRGGASRKEIAMTDIQSTKNYISQMEKLVDIAIINQDTLTDYLVVIGGLQIGKIMLMQDPDYIHNNDLRLCVDKCRTMTDTLTNKIIESGFHL